MKQLLLVFVGGGFGSALRFLIGKWLNSSNGGFPYGTFVVNVFGCFIIGIVIGYFSRQHLNQDQTLFLATGFCGGFTTFSAFAYENQVFLKSGDFTSFAIYTIASFIIGFLAIFLGMYLVKA
ncbi:fluoride efflux transporter CrcB [Winogradskyella flava]|uniref:fluoride efflux transporter CrcB n=1 Tax=Winogradskyella flava TaxID=1884876 RepID=UPI002493BFF6|nr:fluoride efflux transporter CrcB [Winogradskyella flava]